MDALKITLKAARINVGLTMVEAAKHLGISESTLRKYEHGQAFPTVEEIKRIEELYKASYNDFIFSVDTVKR